MEEIAIYHEGDSWYVQTDNYVFGPFATAADADAWVVEYRADQNA